MREEVNSTIKEIGDVNRAARSRSSNAVGQTSSSVPEKDRKHWVWSKRDKDKG